MKIGSPGVESSIPSTNVTASSDRRGGATQDPLRADKQFFTLDQADPDQPQNHQLESPQAREPQGKKRSKFNAVKYGFFSKSILLAGESRAEYDALLNGLREDYQPLGKLKNIEVEYLSALYWHRRRYFEVECAEMSKKDFIEVDSLLTLIIQGLNWGNQGDAKDEKPGENNNLRILRNAVDGLTSMRLFLMANKRKDLKQFKKFLGLNDDGVVPESFTHLFLEVLRLTAEFKAGDAETEDTDETNKIICEAIDVEVKRLMELHNEVLNIERQKIASDGSVLSLLSQKVLDPLLRCQSHLSREIERTQAPIERLQRRRKGQPLPPQLDVNIS